jgi:putative membrane protein
MWASAIVSALHMVGLSLVIGGVVMRSAALRGPFDDAGFKKLFIADNLWGASAVVMLTTGLSRALTNLEKGPDYYLHAPFFWVKMALFVSIFALEIWPMTTFVAWRIARNKGQAIDTSRAPVFRKINRVQMLLAFLMIFAASAMAKGV